MNTAGIDMEEQAEGKKSKGEPCHQLVAVEGAALRQELDLLAGRWP